MILTLISLVCLVIVAIIFKRSTYAPASSDGGADTFLMLVFGFATLCCFIQAHCDHLRYVETPQYTIKRLAYLNGRQAELIRGIAYQKKLISETDQWYRGVTNMNHNPYIIPLPDHYEENQQIVEIRNSLDWVTKKKAQMLKVGFLVGTPHYDQLLLNPQ